MTKSVCILQVEDDGNDVFFLRHAFGTVGVEHPLRVARDGEEAIEYLSGAGEYADRERHPLPCLVLLDLKLPRKDGFEVLRWIRAEPGLRDLTVIVLTSSGREEDIRHSYAMGANSYVVKPGQLQERLELVRLIQAYWLRFHQMPPSCHQGGRGVAELQHAKEVCAESLVGGQKG
jgi:CheY-like chemotaxis protein